MDFLTSVKSAVQFSVKCVKYVHFFAFFTVNVFHFLAFVNFLTLSTSTMQFSQPSLLKNKIRQYATKREIKFTSPFVTSLAFVAFLTFIASLR